MNKKSVATILFVIMCVMFIAGCVMLHKAYNKMTKYNNSEYYLISENAYVSGDAYNYIINGTYSTTFCVAGMGCFIMSLISFIGGCYFYTVETSNDERRNQLPALD